MIEDKYADIIDLPHHVSTVHPQMSMLSRAAQFAPFAALNGHGEAIEATARRNEAEFSREDVGFEEGSGFGEDVDFGEGDPAEF